MTCTASQPPTVKAGNNAAAPFRQSYKPRAVLVRGHSRVMAQARTTDVKASAATLDAPVSSPLGAAADGYPTEAARRTAFSEEFTPELRDPVEAQVQGSIPTWLKGSMIRNGPGTFKGMRHLFDGYGMLVKLHIDNGKVHVQQRFVDSLAFREFKRTGKPEFREFCHGPGLLKAVWRTVLGLTGFGQGFTDNSSVSVVSNGDGSGVLSLTESVAGTYRASTADLSTLGRVDFKDGVEGLLTTAHPTVMKDGTMINLTSGFGTHYVLFRQHVDSNMREEIAKVPLVSPPTPSWVHDFPVTQNWAVIPETPIFFNLQAALYGTTRYVMFDWKPEMGTTLHLINLKTGAVRKVSAPAYFTFHYVNAFETDDGSALCFDFARFTDPEQLNNYYLDNLRNKRLPVAASPLVRMTVPLDEGATSASMEPLMRDDTAYTFSELPRVHPDHKGKPYRYAYSVSAQLPAGFGNALAKFDVQEGTTKTWHSPGTIPMEPIMVPRPGSQDEDDGAVLSLVADADGGSFLLVLDARSFEELARARLPHGIPYGFHGAFIPAAA